MVPSPCVYVLVTIKDTNWGYECYLEHNFRYLAIRTSIRTKKLLENRVFLSWFLVRIEVQIGATNSSRGHCSLSYNIPSCRRHHHYYPLAWRLFPTAIAAAVVFAALC